MVIKIAEQFKKLDKVVVNTGIGRLSSQPNFNDKILPEIVKEFSMITGQKPMLRPASESIASFKLRSGTVVGLKATLRKQRMAQFLNRVINLTLPRVRDFRGIGLKNVDKSGNLSFGVKEQAVFSEISPDISKVNFGVEITVVPKGVKSRDEAIAIYKEIGIPFSKQKHG
ncbi:MAG: 50S ribosomal protein L5 [Patescibacteria group bacterium]